MLKAAIVFFVLGILTFTLSAFESDEATALKSRFLLSIFLLFSVMSLIAGLFISSSSL